MTVKGMPDPYFSTNQARAIYITNNQKPEGWFSRNFGVIVFVCLTLALIIISMGGAFYFDKTSCEQKQEFGVHNSFDYEYHFPAGCIWVPKVPK